MVMTLKDNGELRVDVSPLSKYDTFTLPSAFEREKIIYLFAVFHGRVSIAVNYCDVFSNDILLPGGQRTANGLCVSTDYNFNCYNRYP